MYTGNDNVVLRVNCWIMEINLRLIKQDVMLYDYYFNYKPQQTIADTKK